MSSGERSTVCGPASRRMMPTSRIVRPLSWPLNGPLRTGSASSGTNVFEIIVFHAENESACWT